ncbi:MAG: ABC transporter ATP-binding protein [Mesorhizobium sp.]|uniref:ABC transporter ATP-binding protein n=1 Tax=Mesorhizobium sp. TaxID=1871066 RepID=UPI000FE6E95A|nr:ABC transporter ATP-binding protein [Mesorhizobium sp.]RWH58684.1 MAG: ABC transporter ATP-binding protein [Mesorhizobium sp.]
MAPDALVRLENVSKVFPGGVVGLDAVDLDIAAGEFLTLLGPSGCGKTTSLRVIAGFESPTSGNVLLEGGDITGLRPFDRPVNTVFQDYALFPHMDVAANVGFGLSLRKLSGTEQAKRVGQALDMVGLADKLRARISELSGGQRQRVALARAIVCEPRVLLLDEPLSALDAHLREQMQVELKRLQSRLGTTFVMVTHDQTEALSISDRIVVMNKGRIEQIAPPATLYDRPATRFVASFIGTMNLLQSRFVGRDGERLRFTAGEAAEGTAPARVSGIVFHGRTLRLHAELGQGTAIVIDAPRRADGFRFSIGDVAHVSLRRGANCPVLSN